MSLFALNGWRHGFRKIKAWLMCGYYGSARRLAKAHFQFAVLLINALLVLMISFSFVLMALAAAQIQFQQKVEPDGVVQKVTDLVFMGIPEKAEVSSLKPEDKAAVLGSIISAAGAMVTAVFSMVAWFYSWVLHRAQQKKGMVASERVYDKTGLDDVLVMYEAYRGAKEIHVIGGDFSWLKENVSDEKKPTYAHMRDLVTSMAKHKKINLYSYSDDASVLSTIGKELHTALAGRIKFVPKLRGVRASLVECPYGRTLLYKVHSDKETMHICQISDRTPDGKLLLEQFKVLIGTL